MRVVGVLVILSSIVPIALLLSGTTQVNDNSGQAEFGGPVERSSEVNDSDDVIDEGDNHRISSPSFANSSGLYNYAIYVTPESRQIRQGESTYYNITVDLMGNRNLDIRLSVGCCGLVDAKVQAVLDPLESFGGECGCEMLRTVLHISTNESTAVRHTLVTAISGHAYIVDPPIYRDGRYSLEILPPDGKIRVEVPSLEGLVLEAALLSVRPELTIQRDSDPDRLVRSHLNEEDFATIPRIKNFLEEIDMKTAIWEETCIRDGKIDVVRCSKDRGTSDMSIDEFQMELLLAIINPEEPEFKKFRGDFVEGDQDVQYSSFIEYNGRRFAILISAIWVVPP